jgi:hypothetical protein
MYRRINMENLLRPFGRSLLLLKPGVALVLAVCLCSVAAQCSTVDFSSDITSMSTSAWTLGFYVAAIFGGLAVCFGLFKLVGRDWVPGLIGLGLGIVVLTFVGHIGAWTTALTGVQVP